MSDEPLLPGAADDARVAEAERLIRHYVGSGAFERVVHRPAESLGGSSLHDLAVEDPARLLAVVRKMFDLRRAGQ